MKKISLIMVTFLMAFSLQAFNMVNEGCNDNNTSTNFEEDNSCTATILDITKQNSLEEMNNVKFYAQTEVNENIDITSSTFEVVYNNGYKVNYFGHIDPTSGDPVINLNIDCDTNSHLVQQIKVTIYTSDNNGNNCSSTQIRDWSSIGGICASTANNIIDIAQQD
ncbi:hypothetical protein [Mesonia sp. K7]|uniref:hypothetical protein n=1 Tax=Mesonia sp. K7 TaxID=2218606 RepID=UPI000DA88A7B|nr:hypothetical protein [Mesonia sp. K7]PZD79043.1 hypothetical protein DNG35_03275 [Mesonia sp. K7]